MQITNKLKERFIRDCKIPVKLFVEPYFTERLQLCDKAFNAVEDYNLFLETVNKFETEDAYFEAYNKIKDDAINFIKATPEFEEFNNLDMNQFAIKNIGFSTKDIYHKENIGKRFVSIDMRKANFSSLRHYNANIFSGAETWEEFISLFTYDAYIIKSKYIREVILGNCNPKKHITYEKYLMDAILTGFLDGGIDKNNVVYFGNDEIVINITDHENYLDIIKSVVDTADIPLRIDPFLLRAVQNKDKSIMGYIRYMDNGKYDFKCFTNYTMPFVLRLLNNESITDSDLVFEYEGYLSKFIDTPELTLI